MGEYQRLWRLCFSQNSDEIRSSFERILKWSTMRTVRFILHVLRWCFCTQFLCNFCTNEISQAVCNVYFFSSAWLRVLFHFLVRDVWSWIVGNSFFVPVLHKFPVTVYLFMYTSCCKIEKEVGWFYIHTVYLRDFKHPLYCLPYFFEI